MSAARRCPACGEESKSLDTHVCAAERTGPARPGASERDPSDVAAVEAAPPPGPRYGTLLAGRYVLVAEAGEGSGGTVFRAYDRDLDLHVALKVLPPGDVPTALLKRLKREIRITRDIDHPNVSRVFDLGTADGRSFLTMRWIDGEPLHRRVRREGPLGKGDLRRLARGLIAALAAAHRLGVVHRDVKPANVLVSPPGEPVLVDFGVATDEGTSPAAQARRGERVTLDGQIPGTPAFMAPEQVRGETTRPTTDLYSLALTLSYAASGELGRPDSPERVLAPLGRPLTSLLVRCLEEDPSRRPPDAVALERALQGFARRRRTLLWAVPGLTSILLAAVAFVFVTRHAAREAATSGPPVVHVEPLENRTGDPALEWLEHGIADLLVAGFESSGRVRLAMGAAARERASRIGGSVVREGDAVAVDLVLRAADGTFVARSHVPDATGDALFGGMDEALRQFHAALGVPARSDASDPARTKLPTDDIEAFAHYARAQDLIRAHRGREAMRELRQATVRDSGFALAHLERYILVVSGSHGSRAEAASALELARAHADRLPPSRRELLEAVLEARSSEGSSKSFHRLRTYLRAHPPEAEMYRLAYGLRRVSSDARRSLLEEWAARIPEDPEPHNQLGYLLSRIGDPAGAEREFREYLRLAPGEANAHDSYGDFLREEGRLQEALREYERALEIDPTFASAAVDAADAALRGDDLDGAEVLLARARAIVPPESRDFMYYVQANAAVPILGGDLRGGLRRLEGMARDPATGSRGYVAREYSAILRGLEGDVPRARREAREADRLHRLYHGSDEGLPSLLPYVEGLAAHRRGNTGALARAVAEITAPEPGRADASRRILLEALHRGLVGDPSGAAEHLLGASTSPHDGVSFLAMLERARALARAARVAEANVAYENVIERRPPLAATAEAAHEWRRCLAEVARRARDRGDGPRAAAFEARLAALALKPDPRPR